MPCFYNVYKVFVETYHNLIPIIDYFYCVLCFCSDGPLSMVCQKAGRVVLCPWDRGGLSKGREGGPLPMGKRWFVKGQDGVILCPWDRGSLWKGRVWWSFAHGTEAVCQKAEWRWLTGNMPENLGSSSTLPVASLSQVCNSSPNERACLASTLWSYTQELKMRQKGKLFTKKHSQREAKHMWRRTTEGSQRSRD